MKPLPAILFAVGITAVMIVAMGMIGMNALLNQNTVPIASAPVTANITNVNLPAGDPQSLAAQYQQQIQQDQAQINDLTARLSQANQTIQAYQKVLAALQQRGLIKISSSGQISIPGDH